ncbi:MAG: molybdenum cofactor guanylyltransferase [bacterium]|nr:molybdenum cofactor guanylyltransferase [bacterium]
MNYSGIILAGGKSARMGQDKALMELDGTPMIQHVTKLLSDFVSEIIVASNNKVHHVFGDIGVTDNVINAGPMAGIEAGLKIAKNDACIVLSCDTPFLDVEILSSLTESHFQDAVIARCEERVHPLIGIYRKSALPTIQEQLNQKNFKMMELLKKINTDYVDFPSTKSKNFINLNTQEAWSQASEK